MGLQCLQYILALAKCCFSFARASTRANNDKMWWTLTLTRTFQPSFRNFSVGSPMERIGVDVLGPFCLLEGGNRYIHTAMDYFTTCPEIYCLPDQEAGKIVGASLEGMFSRFGTPDVIHTKQRKNFKFSPCVRNWALTRPAPPPSKRRAG